jgi:F-type H+-transporting ATPase subunit b
VDSFLKAVGDILYELGLRWQLVAAQLVGFLLVFAILKTFLFERVDEAMAERAKEEERRSGALATARKETETTRGKLAARDAEIAKQAYEIAQTEVRAGTKKKAEVSAAANEAARVALVKNREALAREYQESVATLKKDVETMALMVVGKALERDVARDARWTSLASDKTGGVLEGWDSETSAATLWGAGR